MKSNHSDKRVSRIANNTRQTFILFAIAGLFFCGISIRDNDWDKFVLTLVVLGGGGLAYLFCRFIFRIVDKIDS